MVVVFSAILISLFMRKMSLCLFFIFLLTDVLREVTAIKRAEQNKSKSIKHFDIIKISSPCKTCRYITQVKIKILSYTGNIYKDCASNIINNYNPLVGAGCLSAHFFFFYFVRFKRESTSVIIWFKQG